MQKKRDTMKKNDTPVHSATYFTTGAPLFRQLAAATRNGLPLHEVTHLLAQDLQTSTASRNVMQTLTKSLACGNALSVAMGKVPFVFPSVTVDWVRLAENKERLADTLETLASDGERESMGRGELRLALLWPAALGVVVFVVLAITMIFVMPAFSDAYASMGVALPELTRDVFGWIQITADYWWISIPLLALMLVGYAKRLLPGVLLRGLDEVLHGIGFVRRVGVARFMARLVGLLQSTGSDTDSQRAALAHLGGTTSTPGIAKLCMRLQGAVVTGTALSIALEAEKMLPQRAALYVRLGEKMQDLRAPLAQLSQEADMEHRMAVARFERGTILTVYVALGIVIFELLRAIYLPIFKLGQII
jgi:type IV pilus assembly protein PilC